MSFVEDTNEEIKKKISEIKQYLDLLTNENRQLRIIIKDWEKGQALHNEHLRKEATRLKGAIKELEKDEEELEKEMWKENQDSRTPQGKKIV